MWPSPIVFLLCSFPSVHCLIYIDHIDADGNSAIANYTISFTHDATGNSLSNATFITFVTITKMRIYVKIRLAEDQNDKEYKNQIVSSVVEIDKILKGWQSNRFIRHFFQDLQKSMGFRFEMPLRPVRLQENLKYFLISIFQHTGNIQIHEHQHRHVLHQHAS